MKKIIAIIALVMILLFLVSDKSANIIPEYSNNNSVVKIRCDERTGSGFFIDKTTVVTAAHIFSYGNKSCIISDRLNSYFGNIDTGNDFAVGKVPYNSYYAAYPINCSGVQTGRQYYTMGFPFGGSLAQRPATGMDGYTDGHFENGYIHHLRYMHGITTEGMSGGPVFDDSGRVVAIINGMLASNHDILLVKELKDTSVCFLHF